MINKHLSKLNLLMFTNVKKCMLARQQTSNLSLQL